jgi:hypothetical protein
MQQKQDDDDDPVLRSDLVEEEQDFLLEEAKRPRLRASHLKCWIVLSKAKPSQDLCDDCKRNGRGSDVRGSGHNSAPCRTGSFSCAPAIVQRGRRLPCYRATRDSIAQGSIDLGIWVFTLQPCSAALQTC